VKQDKQRQRELTLSRRDEMAPDVRERLSQSLADHCGALLASSGIDGLIISGFWPMRSEIDPRPVMSKLRAQGAQLALPALIGEKQEKRMVFRLFEPNQPLIPMGFDTFGPGEEATVVDPDIVLMPLAAFDAKGNRIGYGGGFYDRTIAHMHARGLDPRLIGLAFDCQEVDHIAAEPHDIRMEAILTESGLRQFDNRSE